MVKNKLEGLEKPIKVSEFAKQAGKREFEEEFNILEQVTYLPSHRDRFNKDPAVQSLNRYCDILPCKGSLNKFS